MSTFGLWCYSLVHLIGWAAGEDTRGLVSDCIDREPPRECKVTVALPGRPRRSTYIETDAKRGTYVTVRVRTESIMSPELPLAPLAGMGLSTITLMIGFQVRFRKKDAAPG